MKTTNSERTKTELLDIQRWEEEGGQMNEHNELMTDRPLVQPVPINTGRHARSLQWNERLVIEPFHSDHGIFLIRKKHTTRTH